MNTRETTPSQHWVQRFTSIYYLRTDSRRREKHSRNEVSLELVEIDVETAIEAQGCSDTRNDLSNDSVQVGEARRSNVKVLLANIVDSFVVNLERVKRTSTPRLHIGQQVTNHERAVNMFESGMGGEDRIVRLDNRAGHLGSWVHSEFKLGLFPVVPREALQEKSTLQQCPTQQRFDQNPSTKNKCKENRSTHETTASSTAERVENKESLQSTAVVRKSANFVHDIVDKFFTDSIMTTSI